MKKLNLAVETEGDGKKWNFVGIWAKNREEWTTTHIANMYMTYTTIGFFDSMGVSAVDFILEQTELSTMFTTMEYIKKVIQMKKDKLARTVKNFVCFDAFTDKDKEECKEHGLNLYHFSEVLEIGGAATDIPFNKCNENDCPIFSYTSGTTGDSKGVKLTHRNLHSSCL